MDSELRVTITTFLICNVFRINTQILFYNQSPEDGNSEHLQEDILFVMKTNSTVKSWKVKKSVHRNKHQHQYAATISKTTADNEEIRITVYNGNSFQHVGFRLKIRSDIKWT